MSALTRAEIDAMTLPELRIAVAELVGDEYQHVFDGDECVKCGLTTNFHNGRMYDGSRRVDAPRCSLPADYPRDIGAADLVVSEMERRGYRVTVSAYPGALHVKSCTMQIGRGRRFIATADTRAAAISKAALFAAQAAKGETE